MAKENMYDSNMHQARLIDNLNNHIIPWMREYEKTQFAIKNPSKELEEQYMTQIPKDVNGLCVGLCAMLAHAAITDEQIYQKRQANIKAGRDQEEGIKPTPDTVEAFYEQIHHINTLKALPDIRKDAARSKTFYQDMQILNLKLAQLQASDMRNASDIPSVQNMHTILNEASPDGEARKMVHTYYFKDTTKLLDWSKDALPGDILSVSSINHSTLVYITRDSKGEKIVGFYDPNHDATLELLPTALNDMNIKEFLTPTLLGTLPQDEQFLICNHIVNSNSAHIAPNIQDDAFNHQTSKHICRMIAHHGTVEQIRKWIKAEDALYDTFGKTPMHYAAINRNIGILETLHDINPHFINTGDNDGGTQPLHFASSKGNTNIVEKLLVMGANVNATNNNGSSSLHLASQNNRTKIVEKLLVMCANVNATNNAGESPLHPAASNGHSNIVKILLANGADFNAQDNTGESPLHFAASKGHSNIVEQLLSKGADVNIKDSNSRTPLHFAAANGYSNIVEQLLSKGADVKAQDKSGNKPIDYAKNLSAESYSEIKHLLDNALHSKMLSKAAATPASDVKVAVDSFVAKALADGGDVNKKDSTGKSPIHIAASKGDANSIEQLLVKGVDVNTRSIKGSTPLHFAVFGGNLNSIAKLLAHGADVNAKDDDGNPLIDYMFRSNISSVQRAEIKKLLSKHELSLKTPPKPAAAASSPVEKPLAQKDDTGKTPLHIAIAEGDEKSVAQLLLKKADVNAKNHKGSSPLHFAIHYGHPKIVDKLLSQGSIDVNATNIAGESILHFATSKSDSESVAKLLAKQANVNIKDSKGRSPLHIATSKGDPKIIEQLLANGADMDAQDNDGRKPIDYMRNLSTKHQDAIKHLLENAHPKTPPKVMTAAAAAPDSDSTTSFVKKILSDGDDVNKKDYTGRTPLHIAASKGDANGVKQLLAAGADANITTTSTGLSPLHIAASKGNADIVKQLLDAGADSKALATNGKAPIDYVRGSDEHQAEIKQLLAASHSKITPQAAAAASWTDRVDVKKAATSFAEKHSTSANSDPTGPRRP